LNLLTTYKNRKKLGTFILYTSEDGIPVVGLPAKGRNVSLFSKILDHTWNHPDSYLKHYRGLFSGGTIAGV
jgi:hypothetical protein